MGSGRSRNFQPGVFQPPMPVAPMAGPCVPYQPPGVPVAPIAAPCPPAPYVQPMPIVSSPFQPHLYPVPQQNVGLVGAGSVGGPCAPNQWQRSDFSRAYSENVCQMPPPQPAPQPICQPQYIQVPQQPVCTVTCPVPMPAPQPQPCPIPMPMPMPMPAPQPCPIPMPVPQPCPVPMPMPMPGPQPCPMPCPFPQPGHSCGPFQPCPPCPPAPPSFGGGMMNQPFDQAFSVPSFNPQSNTYTVDYGRTSFTPWCNATRLTQ